MVFLPGMAMDFGPGLVKGIVFRRGLVEGRVLVGRPVWLQEELMWI